MNKKMLCNSESLEDIVVAETNRICGPQLYFTFTGAKDQWYFLLLSLPEVIFPQDFIPG